MSQANPVLAGLACRCPNCGKAPLFEGFLKVRAACRNCGVDLSAADSGDGPAVFVTLIVGGLVAFAALVTEFTLRPPMWLHLVLWLPLTAGLGLAVMRPFKALLIALQFHFKAREAGGQDA